MAKSTRARAPKTVPAATPDQAPAATTTTPAVTLAPALAPKLQAELEMLGLETGEDALVELEMLTGLSGPQICLNPKDRHRFGPAEAVRFVLADLAKKPEA